MSQKNKAHLILAIHPTYRGFGWVLFESTLVPYDWGIASAKANRNARLIARFERLLNRYQPTAVVLEQFEHGERIDRVRRLCRRMVHLAACRGIDAPTYSMAAIRTCFSSVGATTRFEIAQTVGLHIEALRHRLPPQRKRWRSDDVRMSLFNAAAVAITHLTIRRGAE
jgi:hypothetical protein